MCDVCKAEGKDYLFKNGPKKDLTVGNLYKVFVNAVASVKLCHVHSIELFHVGEKRFLKEHLDFSRTLAQKNGRYSKDSLSAFGL